MLLGFLSFQGLDTKTRVDRANRDVFRKTLTDFAVFEMIILDDLQRGGTFTNVEDVVEHARTAE